MSKLSVKPGQILRGSLFAEPMRVETVRRSGADAWVLGLVGTQSERFRNVTLSETDFDQIHVLDSTFDYQGDGRVLRLGLQAYSLGIAYEFDPYFGLSISRVDPHPERETAEVRRLQPNFETEQTAMRVVIEYEQSLGRQVYDVHEKNLGYDITSLDLNSGELRLIEVKGIGAARGTVLLTPNERRVAEDRRECYWLYVVTDCNTTPTLQEPIKNPARFDWHEVKKVDHYWLEVNAMTKPMEIREGPEPYSKKD